MLKFSDWLIDKRPIKPNTGKSRYLTYTWQEWLAKHKRDKEDWLFSIIRMLMENQNWAGAYLLIQTYIVTLKQAEGDKWYNRTPFDESPHVRVVRYWFWDLVEECGFVTPEEETPYDQQNIEDRRAAERKAAESYPFVGGKPKRRYSETAEFFEQVKEDRSLTDRAVRISRNPERIAAGKKPRGNPRTLRTKVE